MYCNDYKKFYSGQPYNILSSFYKDRNRVTFQRADACDLPESLGQFGIVLAANLICRLHNPQAFLNLLPRLVASGGILVITAPYTWQEEFCDKVN